MILIQKKRRKIGRPISAQCRPSRLCANFGFGENGPITAAPTFMLLKREGRFGTLGVTPDYLRFEAAIIAAGREITDAAGPAARAEFEQHLADMVDG